MNDRTTVLPRLPWPRPGAALLAWGVGLGALLALVGRNVARNANVLYDDAFITLRVAQHLARGDGPVYNVGERVEASSTPLFTFALALPIRLGASALTAAQVVGVAGFAACVAATCALVRRGGGAWWLAFGAAVVTARSAGLAAYATSGMETTAFVALLLWTAWAALGPRSRALPILAALLTLARPEGFAFALLLLAIGARRGGGARAGATWLALIAPFFLFRVLYFHEIVANAVLAKSSFWARLVAAPIGALPALVTRGDGARLLALFADKTLSGAVAIGVAGLAIPRTRRVLAAAVGVAVVAVAVSIWAEGDWMPFHRLLLPLVPLAGVAIALGASALLGGARADRLGRLALTGAVAIAFVFASNKVDEPAPHRAALDAADAHRVGLGKKLAAVALPGDLIATDIAGVVPFYADLPTVDMFGLCDAHIAHEGARGGKMGKSDLPYVIARRPTIYVLNFGSVLRELVTAPAFAPERGDWVMLRTPFDKSSRSVAREKKVVLVRRDRPNLRELRRVFSADLVDLDQALRERP